MIKEAIKTLVAGNSLTIEQAAEVMQEIMDGEATPAQFGAFVTALRLKGETVAEIIGLAKIMRARAVHVDVVPLLGELRGVGRAKHFAGVAVAVVDKVGNPAHVPDVAVTAPVVGARAGILRRLRVKMHTKARLPEVVRARHGHSGLTGGVQRGHKNGHEDRYNRDHHEQFDKRKTFFHRKYPLHFFKHITSDPRTIEYIGCFY